ncbi:hypothetical protein L1887_54906 [Cichorium endivia]|nr:hypothetical protein L1887_54906 [Cichorium endivia]
MGAVAPTRSFYDALGVLGRRAAPDGSNLSRQRARGHIRCWIYGVIFHYERISTRWVYVTRSLFERLLESGIEVLPILGRPVLERWIVEEESLDLVSVALVRRKCAVASIWIDGRGWSDRRAALTALAGGARCSWLVVAVAEHATCIEASDTGLPVGLVGNLVRIDAVGRICGPGNTDDHAVARLRGARVARVARFARRAARREAQEASRGRAVFLEGRSVFVTLEIVRLNLDDAILDQDVTDGEGGQVSLLDVAGVALRDLCSHCGAGDAVGPGRPGRVIAALVEVHEGTAHLGDSGIEPARAIHSDVGDSHVDRHLERIFLSA